ncbi:class F sortase [Streptomyces mesophilus]|uniref:class F sortase n=1 Tax=Streptomyces mesophilus TaxID=1775132 RepID=UPI0033174074
MARSLSSLLLTGAALVLFSVAVTEQGITGPPPQPGLGQAFEAGTDRTAKPLAELPSAAPTRVRIGAIGVNAPLMDLDLEPDGRLASPPENDSNLAGWYGDGVAPGSRGTAIIAGHVDIPTGPAVFYHLGALKKGMRIDVSRSDRRTAHFTIDAIEVYDAEDFPDDKVYADSDRAELRVITCGGGYDKHRGRYRGNVVVYAHLTS